MKSHGLTTEDMYYLTQAYEKLWEKQTKKKLNQPYANSINEILHKHNISERINHTHLINIELKEIKTLVLSYFNIRKKDINKLANIVENYIWDTLKVETILYHFTTEDNAKNINQTNTLRLYNILKRYQDGEIRDFSSDFNIPYEIEENYKNIFYSSFTTEIPNITEITIIKNFRQFTGPCGARLKLKVIKEEKNFRFINYCKQKYNIIHDLREAIKAKYNLDLNINGFTTRFASFYVNEKYQFENEARLYKNLLFDKEYIVHTDRNSNTYIELDLTNTCIELQEVIYEQNEEIFKE